MPRPAVRLPLRLLAGAALLAVLAGGTCVGGCTTFDGQTILVRHSAQRDTLDLLLVYRGLRADGPLEEAVAQLQKLRFQRVFAVGHPLFALDLDGVLEPPVGERVPPPPDSLPVLLSGAEVIDLGLWLDAEGRLCGAQRVHVEGIGNVLRQFNAGQRNRFLQDTEALAHWIEDFGLDQPGDAPAIQKVLSDAPDFAFVALDRGAFTLSLPLGPQQSPRVRAKLLSNLSELEVKAEAGEPGALAARRFLLEQDLSLLTDADHMRLVIGNTSRDQLLLELATDRAYDSALPAALRELDWEIGGPETETAVRAAFEEASAGG